MTTNGELHSQVLLTFKNVLKQVSQTPADSHKSQYSILQGTQVSLLKLVVFAGQTHIPPVKLNVESGQLQIDLSAESLKDKLQVPQVVLESHV